MEPTQNTAATLSPFMWQSPTRLVCTPGSAPGAVGDWRQYISDLNVNFDLVVQEMAAPYEHPIHDVFQTHPVHTCAINKRQFDVLRYGMVLDKEQRLVIVEAPRDCADSGARVTREYGAIFKRRLDNTEISKHPLLPEYSLVVMRVPTDEAATAGAIPELLFRVVFRNEAYNEASCCLSEFSASFPLFRLRSVAVPSRVYECMEEVDKYRAHHPGFFTAQDGTVLPNPNVEQALHTGILRDLCDAWVSVVNGIAPQWVREKGLGPDVVALFLKTHRATSTGGLQEEPGQGVQGSTPLLDNRVRMHYSSNFRRMQQRVRVIPREPGLVTRWRDGEFDVPAFQIMQPGKIKRASAVLLAEPVIGPEQCARMLMRLTRGGENNMEDGEICAFIPYEHEYATQHVYRTRAAEKLRLWVLKGLMTAELNNVHSVLVEVDPTMILAQAVGLLHGEETDGEGHAADANCPTYKRKREAMFHVCKIVVETVEDYVQHSGVVWQVTLAVNEEGVAAKTAELCEKILLLTQTSKARIEDLEMARCNRSDHGEDSGDDVGATTEEDNKGKEKERAGAAATEAAVAANRSRAAAERAGRPAGAAADASSRSTALVASRPGAGNWPADGIVVVAPTGNTNDIMLTSSIPAHISERAAAVGYLVNDEALYPIFASLCHRNADMVPVANLVFLLMDKLKGGDHSTSRYDSMYWLSSNPLINIDSCGIPCSERSVTNFVMGFSLKPYRTLCRRSPAPAEVEPALNYVEFSMMMLALAHQ